MNEMPAEVRGYEAPTLTPGQELQAVVRHPTRVLETKLGFSERVVFSLNC